MEIAQRILKRTVMTHSEWIVAFDEPVPLMFENSRRCTVGKLLSAF